MSTPSQLNSVLTEINLGYIIFASTKKIEQNQVNHIVIVFRYVEVGCLWLPYRLIDLLHNTKPSCLVIVMQQLPDTLAEKNRLYLLLLIV